MAVLGMHTYSCMLEPLGWYVRQYGELETEFLTEQLQVTVVEGASTGPVPTFLEMLEARVGNVVPAIDSAVERCEQLTSGVDLTGLLTAVEASGYCHRNSHACNAACCSWWNALTSRHPERIVMSSRPTCRRWSSRCRNSFEPCELVPICLSPELLPWL
jgi:hypothetical protein